MLDVFKEFVQSIIQSLYFVNPVALYADEINFGNWILWIVGAGIAAFFLTKGAFKVFQALGVYLAALMMLKFGGLALHWYGLAYVVAFLTATLYIQAKVAWDAGMLMNYVILGTLAGGKLGNVLLYQSDSLYSRSGMSFHGGLIGVIAAVYMFHKRFGVSVTDLAKHITKIAPVGLFLGRIANAINNEIPGTVTSSWIGVLNKYSNVFRNPVSVYQAFAEGILLFLWMIWVDKKMKSRHLHWFAIGYGAGRFITEFFKADQTITFGLNAGQWLSVGMIACALAFWNKGAKPD